MRSTGARAGLLIVLAIVAVLLFIVLKDDGGDDGGETTPTPAQTTATGDEPAPPAEPAPEIVEMRNGAPVGGVQELSFQRGDQVRILVKLDEPQEDVHIHGYEIEKLNPSGEVLFEFPAKLDGIYELEAHGPSGDVLLAELRINP